MDDNGLPCLDLLEATPTILRGLMAELSADGRALEARARPLFRRRGARAPQPFRRPLLPYAAGPLPERGQSRIRSRTTRSCTWSCTATWIPRMPSTISRSSARPTSKLLRDLPPGAGERKAVHKKVGPITLAQMLHEWALHDLGHIRQIAELVRARKYLAGAGPLGKLLPT